MKRSQWVTVSVVVLATSVVASASARAQASNERIRELMKQAAKQMEDKEKEITFQGGYRLEDFEDLPIDLPASVDDDLSTKPSVHAAFRRFLAIATRT